MSLQAFLQASGPALYLCEVERPEIVLGAFQRAASALRTDQGRQPGVPPGAGEAGGGPEPLEGAIVTRRMSGGPALVAGPGTLHLVLTLPDPRWLVADADVPRLVNRHVRPLLKALTRLGAQAHYFGRDWVSVAHRPAAWVGFAHHAAADACLFEAFVALDEPFALPERLDGYPPRGNPRFLGKAPASVSEAAGRRVEPATAIEAIAAAYDQLSIAMSGKPLPRGSIDAQTQQALRPLALDARPPWSSLVEEAIGFVGYSGSSSAAGDAADDRPELGGDLLASIDLVEAMNHALERLGPRRDEAAVAAALGEAFEAVPRGVIEGVRDLGSLTRAVARRG
jgi:hypothetical protein